MMRYAPLVFCQTISARSGALVSYFQPSGTAKDSGPIVFTSAMARRGSSIVASSNTPAVNALRSVLFGTAGKTPRDGRNRDNRVSRAGCPPRAVKSGGRHRSLIMLVMLVMRQTATNTVTASEGV